MPSLSCWQGGDGSTRPVNRSWGRMGKSKKNGVSPDEFYEDYSADTLRQRSFEV